MKRLWTRPIRPSVLPSPPATSEGNHHPDVVKGLSPGALVVGREAVVNGIAGNPKSAHIEFIESRIESSLAMGDAAVRILHFSIRATPVAGGPASSFAGRSMVVYARSKQSPTGWVTIRELVQPAN
ncbi:MAG TPA: hypothetical protein VKB47_15835 [Terracidiphilus sp.]|nr:hypothetical protein [Terracidiphilus sp.]